MQYAFQYVRNNRSVKVVYWGGGFHERISKWLCQQDQDTKRSFETEEQNDGMELKDNGEESIGLSEVEIVNAARFGNPKEVLDNSVFTSDVEVKKQGKMNWKLNLN